MVTEFCKLWKKLCNFLGENGEKWVPGTAEKWIDSFAALCYNGRKLKERRKLICCCMVIIGI